MFQHRCSPNKTCGRDDRLLIQFLAATPARVLRGKKQGKPSQEPLLFLSFDERQTVDANIGGDSKPGFLTNKPIIVDVDGEFGSPETLTLRYEEAVRAAHRGDLSPDSPLDDFEMAAYSKAQLPSMSGEFSP